ncbi:MAG: hypothetical protein ACYC0V_21590 [Armatimonadota bacterium]
MQFSTLCLVVTIIAAFAFGMQSAQASMPKEDPYVDVYVPAGVNGATIGELRVDTPNYAFSFNCGKGVATGLWVKKTPKGDVQVLGDGKDTDASGSHALSVQVKGKTYLVINHNTPKYVRFRKSGKYMWEIMIEGIELKSRDGEKLPLAVTETFYFWPDKIYTAIDIKATADVSDVEYAEMTSSYSRERFDRINNGSIDTPIHSDSVQFEGVSKVPDSFTLFNSKSKYAVTQSVIEKTDIDSWLYEAEKVGTKDQSHIVSRLRLWDKDIHDVQSTTWKADTTRSILTAYYTVPEGSSASGLRETESDAKPLDAQGVRIIESNPAVASFKGFDLRRGCYNIELQVPLVAFWNVDKNHVSETKFRLRNDVIRRNVRIRTYDTPIAGAMANVVGTFPVLCDSEKNPTGIPVQVSKKWDGNTHPNYHETYMYLPFEPKESQTYWYQTAFHMWGTKTLVGIPSLDLIDWPGVYGPWYETHIGNSETICYATDDRIQTLAQDFRAQGGTQFQGNAGSNWFDNAGGANLTALVINGEIQRMKRRAPGLRWTSFGPCLAQQSWIEQTFPDVADARTKVSTYLLPSLHNTRVFFKYRTDFKERQVMKNMKTDLRIFTLNEENYSAVQVPSIISYLGIDGKIADMKTNYTANKWLCEGLPLSSKKPFVAGHTTITGSMDPRFYPAGVNNNGFIVHEFTGKIGGHKIGMDKLCLSAFQRVDSKCVLSLTPNVDDTEIKPGDYVEALIEMFTWDPADGNTTAIEGERLYNPTTIKVETGEKVSDFPATVKSSDGVADFMVKGGVGFNVIRASGFEGSIPLLEEFIGDKWVEIDQSVKGKDWWQTDYIPADKRYMFTFAVPAADKGGAKRFRIRCRQQ